MIVLIPSSLTRPFPNYATVCLLCVSIAAGCSSLTDVDNPDVLGFADLEDPAGAGALFAGAITRFADAYNGGTRRAVSVSGFLTDELSHATTDIFWDALDSREVSESNSEGLGSGPPSFAELSRARVSAVSALQILQQVAPNPNSRIGRLYALAGYSELLLGELYCSGVSLAVVEGGEPVANGLSLTTVEMFQHALANFDSAGIHSGDNEAISNLARVGRGRALLNLGRLEDAVKAVAEVPSGFVHATGHSSTVAPNGLDAHFKGLNASVANREGENGLAFRTAGDPRVPTQFVGLGDDQQTDVYGWTPVLMGGTATSTVLASGVEARLIEAEGALQAGDASWLTTLNSLRSSAISPEMPPLEDPGSEQERVDLLFHERAFWLFLTAHRLGDLRRLIRQYGRPQDQVFPTGPYRSGRVYGDAVSIPMPREGEAPNPNFVGCLTLDA